MKNHERRAANAYPYYKLAVWDARSFTYRDGRVAYPTQHDAVAAISVPGKYRVSKVTADGRRDLTPFEVGEMVGGD